MATTIFQIEDGEFALAIVNTGALGYLSTWDAPAGKTAETALLTDYDADADVWYQQVTSGQLVATANDNDVTTPATFSQASVVTPQPGVTSFDLQVDFLQDVNVSIGLSQFLFEFDTAEAYFLLGLNAGDPPRAIGRCRIRAGAFGGPARENLTASVTLPCVRKPKISFGDGTTSVITGSLLTMDDEGNIVDDEGNIVTVASAVNGRSALRAEGARRRTAAAGRTQRRAGTKQAARGSSSPPADTSS
jgi:hypothetical protein